MSNLSPLQRRILQWLLYHTCVVEQEDPQWLKYGIDWYHPWTPMTTNKTEDRRLEIVWRASLCRSLARLEKRGLIKRLRGRKQARTTSVLLTDEGRKVAEALSPTITASQ